MRLTLASAEASPTQANGLSQTVSRAPVVSMGAMSAAPRR
jgi:hypothetical protein